MASSYALDDRTDDGSDPERDYVPDSDSVQQKRPADGQLRYAFRSNRPGQKSSMGESSTAQPCEGAGGITDTSDEDGSFSLPLSKATKDQAEQLARLSRVDYLHSMQKSYLSLTDAIFNEERATNTNKAKCHIHWRNSLWRLFASIPTHIFTALLDGSLAYKVLGEQDPDFRPYFQPDPMLADSEQHPWYIQSTASDAPAIYVRLLTDGHGKAPSPVQYMTICAALRRYADGDKEEVSKLDNVWEPRSTANGPYYIQGKVAHARAVFTWCQAIDLMCQVVPRKNWGQPHPVPRSYCGYAKSVSRRGKQYAKRQSCTWIVTLVEAAFHHYYSECSFAFHTFTICFMADEREVELAERAMTRCTNSILRYGGFCVAAPGQCSSAKNANWAFLRHWRYQNTPVTANANAESRRLDQPYYQSDNEQDVFCLQLQNALSEAEELRATRRREIEAKKASIRKILDRIDGIDPSKISLFK
ncbi:hypothetical protein N0V83_010839 [Neocucurbitaria cava]|uniref:Uncharacterized protein n=1 Tax=Neocucurbitaria cava TaxID=798079 RepID=A0A9W8XXB3_9PLEO|nr:hypothetical protein N0V83_010839 [Neocucurbitaria cava]